MSSGKLTCVLRDKVGSRSARKLRREGRLPASLQREGDKPHFDLHLSQEEFITSRRGHVHLYDLDIEGQTEAALVRELQWDSLGDHIIHVEFKRVTRGVATETEVPLVFYGQVEDGVPTHNVTHLTVSCVPSLIPDSIEVNLTGLATGAHIRAGDLALPEGVSLAVPEDLEVAVVSALRGPALEAEAPPDEGAEPVVEGDEPKPEEDESGGSEA